MRKSIMLGLALAGIVMLLAAPAMAELHWGELNVGDCQGTDHCERKYSAVLHGLPVIDQDDKWERACARTPHPALGRPHWCAKQFYIWGNWLVHDRTCGHWCGSQSYRLPKGAVRRHLRQ